MLEFAPCFCLPIILKFILAKSVHRYSLVFVAEANLFFFLNLTATVYVSIHVAKLNANVFNTQTYVKS